MENAAQNVSGDDDPIIKVRGLRHMYSEGDGTKEVLHGVEPGGVEYAVGGFHKRGDGRQI